MYKTSRCHRHKQYYVHFTFNNKSVFSFLLQILIYNFRLKRWLFRKSLEKPILPRYFRKCTISLNPCYIGRYITWKFVTDNFSSTSDHTLGPNVQKHDVINVLKICWTVLVKWWYILYDNIIFSNHMKRACFFEKQVLQMWHMVGHEDNF